MRKLLFVPALAALLVLAASAQAAAPARLTLSLSTYKVLYGHELTLSGRLVHGGAGRMVTVESWRHGRSAPTVVARTTTRSGGRWSARVRPSIQTTYRARVGAMVSVRRTVGVRPLVVLRELGNGHVWTRVTAGRSFAGRLVQLQRAAGGTWRTVARKQLSSASIAVFARTLPTATLRVAFSVNEAGAGYLGSSSHGLHYRPYVLTITPSSYKVLAGHSLTLTGRLVNGHAGAHIAIIGQRFGQSAPRRIATLATGAHGMWSYRVHPAIQTTYEAVSDRTNVSRRLTVGVRPLLTLHELANGRLLVRAEAARGFGGKVVQLQQLANSGSWQTISKGRLDSRSRVAFAIPIAAGSMLRAALSVNQAGAGYLGSTSHSLSYHSV